MTASDEPTPWADAVRLATALGVPVELLQNLYDLHGHQWRLEDVTRSRRASAHGVAAAKAEIDTSNSRRQQMIDTIDAVADVTPAEGTARYYAETIGELCDRLLILQHKLAALERLRDRVSGPSADPWFAAVRRIRKVRAHLSVVVTQLLEDVEAGRAAVPPRAGVKVYGSSARGGADPNAGPDVGPPVAANG